MNINSYQMANLSPLGLWWVLWLILHNDYKICLIFKKVFIKKNTILHLFFKISRIKITIIYNIFLFFFLLGYILVLIIKQ